MTSVWQAEAERLELVLQPSGFDALIKDAAIWADRITLCVTAPQSERGSLPWWQELLARSSKWDRVYLRRAAQTENWLLHRVHETGALRLVEGGGKQVAANLLLFSRSEEQRVLLSHIPLERAVDGAAFGALLGFRGSHSGELARSCRAQADSWGRLARMPMGAEIDALGVDSRRSEPLPPITLPSQLRVLSDPAQLAACIERFTALGLEASLERGWSVSIRAFDSGFRVQLQHRDKARPPVVLTLQAGTAWAAGNALMLQTKSGDAVLAWRGGLLGHSRSKIELLWSEARLPTFLLEEAALGPAQRVAVVAHTAAPLAAQLSAFVHETCRLGEVFGVEPPPTLGHAVSDFSSLSAKQQTLLLWRSLIGLGPLDFGVATLTATQALRDQGYLRGPSAESGSGLYGAIAELLARAAEHGSGFDRPGLGKIRAIQPDLGAYVLDDWQECLLQALPENQSVARRRALRLGFERARSHWGLNELTLRPGSRVERLLEATLTSGLRRGLFVRVGAGGVQRLAPLAHADASAAYRAAAQPSPARARSASEDGLLAGWARALEPLTPAQRFLLARRAGWYCRREALESAAQRLGLSLERARQLELEAWERIETDSDWASTLRERLQRAFAGARSLPVRLLVAEDPWWRGVEQQLGLAEAVFESLFGGEFHHVELGSLGKRQALFARFSQNELERTLERLWERAAALPTPAALEDYQSLPVLSAQELDDGLCEYFRDALEAQLELDPADPAQVLRCVPRHVATLEHLPEPSGVDSEARLRLEDAVRSAFRSARTPLSLEAMSERIRPRVEVSDEALAVLLAHAPFVQRNTDQYGLLARDVPGGHEAIALALNGVVETLEQTLRVLSLNDAFALAQARAKQSWSIELVRSLISSDPALCLSPTGDVRLRRWEHARLVAANELLCPGMPAGARPRFERLCQAALGDAGELSRQLRAQLSRLERGVDCEDFFALSLARQLGDVYERLLEHVSTQAPDRQRVARAAISFFLETSVEDEDDLDAPGIEREKLSEARAVLAAVLGWLDLDWLDLE